MKLHTLLSVLCVMALGASAATQMPETGPSAELKKLDWMIGEWSGSMNWTMPGMEGENRGTMKAEWEGNFLKTTGASDMMGMSMTEASYTAWDAKEKKYVTWTFANFAPMPRIERGTLNGDTIVFVSEPWETDFGTSVSRATITRKGDSEIRLLLEFKEDDSWVKVADGIYKKKRA